MSERTSIRGEAGKSDVRNSYRVLLKLDVSLSWRDGQRQFGIVSGQERLKVFVVIDETNNIPEAPCFFELLVSE